MRQGHDEFVGYNLDRAGVVKPGLPREVIGYAEESASLWLPTPVVVMEQRTEHPDLDPEDRYPSLEFVATAYGTARTQVDCRA